MPKTYTLTADQRASVGEALDLAYSDQQHWLNYGNPELDYDGSELADKADTFRAFGSLGEALGFYGEAERWEGLAKAVLGEETDE